MLKKTPLNESHKKMGAKMVPFAGWEMPLHYSSIIDEHAQVRQNAGVFDVSHMRAVDVLGSESKSFLRHLLANDVQKLHENGAALYGCMLNEQGGILDDLITYRINQETYRLVVNAATTEKDLDWIQTHALNYKVKIQPRNDLAMLAIQGPKALDKLKMCLSADMHQQVLQLKPFTALEWKSWFIARTGYTGEQGVEIVLPNEDSVAFWERLVEQSIHPIGLGARDTLRLEAGLNLYGQDMDESVTPLESNLAWTVDLKDDARTFVGKAALLQQKKKGLSKQLVGVVLKEKGVLRPHMVVYADESGIDKLGTLTSGSFSPTLGTGIGFAQIKLGNQTACWIEMRGKYMAAQIVKPPFVKSGKPNI